jgi:hypothetical protein
MNSMDDKNTVESNAKKMSAGQKWVFMVRYLYDNNHELRASMTFEKVMHLLLISFKSLIDYFTTLSNTFLLLYSVTVDTTMA